MSFLYSKEGNRNDGEQFQYCTYCEEAGPFFAIVFVVAMAHPAVLLAAKEGASVPDRLSDTIRLSAPQEDS